MLYPLSYRGTPQTIVLWLRDGFHMIANSNHGSLFLPKGQKSPHLLGRAVGAFSLEEDMTLISIRILLSCEFPGGILVTSCEYTV